MMKQILILWAVPRSISTAFERMMIERGDFTVFDEPFSEYYYFSNNRVANRYDKVTPKEAFNYENILEKILLASYRQSVFVKDMAFHVKQCMTHKFLNNFKNTFIIRHPKFTLPSQFKILPDFTLEETGYEQQYRLFQMLCDMTGTPPIVIDGEDLCNNPELIIKAYSDNVGIPFIPDSLHWQAELPSQLKLWKKWYKNVAESTGFQRYTNITESELILKTKKKVSKAYNFCLPFYEKIFKYRIQVV